MFIVCMQYVYSIYSVYIVCIQCVYSMYIVCIQYVYLLITYFIGNISAKIYQNAVTCVKVIANQRLFETQCRMNAAVWLTPTTRVPCSNAAKTRNPMKLPGVPQTNEMISAASGPKFTILRGHVEEILLLNKFFSDYRYMPQLRRQVQPDKVVRWCPDDDFWRLFWVLYLQ